MCCCRILRWPAPGPSPVPYGRSKGLTEPGTDHCRVGTSVPHGGQNVKCQHTRGCLFNVTADRDETNDLLPTDDPALMAAVASMRQLLATAGAAAPPVSRYFAEANASATGKWGPGGNGGGFFDEVKAEMCAASIARGDYYLEPTR
eukprot:SAG22_NODE_2906_length_2113_cov_5.399206_1_plen_146_part_00